MNYFNDLAQTGTDAKHCLKLFWPFSAQTIHRIDRKLPKWTRMLHDGQATCCFAVAVDECLIYSGDSQTLYCKSTRPPRGGGSGGEFFKENLLSTTINLQENPTVRPPLSTGDILKLDPGRLRIISYHREGFAQEARFWLPSAMDKLIELRLGPRTHTELLNPGRSTGLCVDVCIHDATG
jgi:hypothetical protein